MKRFKFYNRPDYGKIINEADGKPMGIVAAIALAGVAGIYSLASFAIKAILNLK